MAAHFRYIEMHLPNETIWIYLKFHCSFVKEFIDNKVALVQRMDLSLDRDIFH